MKIALCMSGQLRAVEQCYPSIDAGLRQGFDVDTFVHAWWDASEVGTQYSHGAWHDLMPGCEGDIEVKPNADAQMLDLYSPVKYLVEPQIDFTQEAEECMLVVQSHVELPPHCMQPRFGFCLLSMFYSMWQSNELKRQYERAHGFLYDAVVRCRFDLDVRSKGVYGDLDLAKISTAWTWLDDFGDRGCGDMLAISSSANMDVYSGVYPAFKHLCSVTEDPLPYDHPKGHGWGAESLLNMHVREHGIEVNRSSLQAINVRV